MVYSNRPDWMRTATTETAEFTLTLRTEVGDALAVVTVSSVERQASISVLYRRAMWDPMGWERLPPEAARLAVREHPWGAEDGAGVLSVGDTHVRLVQLAALHRWPSRWALVPRAPAPPILASGRQGLALGASVQVPLPRARWVATRKVEG